ncbi:hypothetical protein K8T06_12290 [bacterium]|nr:hypothetical protein [bacterium]
MMYSGFPIPAGSGGSREPIPYRAAKAIFEKKYLSDLLTWSGGNVKRAAEQAGRDRKGLYILMSKHGIYPATYRKRKKR